MMGLEGPADPFLQLALEVQGVQVSLQGLEKVVAVVDPVGTTSVAEAALHPVALDLPLVLLALPGAGGEMLPRTCSARILLVFHSGLREGWCLPYAFFCVLGPFHGAPWGRLGWRLLYSKSCPEADERRILWMSAFVL
jgi:hypothetical protein